ncbi:AAA family ATPase [Streptococcus thoraltensis]|uniref:AAA family ATPase n=1 Tax=Streptococcus thoraltensis TaxID=55085 RepID=UPI00035DD448|nr:AAA family ATPase [Streptococcus thoraltensis]MDY4760607.1 AAA family ATPase [Streptococcus thoraltensis]
MKKIIVIGCPGSGKSTLARQLAELTKLPLHHLDLMNWNADRTTVAPEIFLERQRHVLKQDSWIIDGNYGGTLDLRFKACDTIIFLDFPLDVCIEGVMNRIGTVRSDMPWVEEEVDLEFLDFIKEFPENSRPKILALIDKFSHKNIYQLISREEAEEFLQAMKKAFEL